MPLRVAAVVIGLLFATPVVYLVSRTVGEGTDIVGEVASSRTLVPLRNTLLLATSVTVSTMVLGTATAWLVARTDVPGRRLWRVLLPLPLVFPSFAGALALVAAVAPGGLLAGLLGADAVPSFDGFDAAFITLTLFTYPYVHLPVSARLRGLPPSLEESARLLGRSPASVFVSVVLPQAAPTIAAGGLLSFLYVVSDFGAVSLTRFDTLTRVIYASRLFDRERAFTLALLLAVIAMAVVAAERWVARRPVAVAPTAARPRRAVPLGRWRWPAAAALGAVVTAALLTPAASLLHWTIRGMSARGGSRIDLGPDLAELARPALITAGVACVTALAGVAVVLPVAYLVARWAGPTGSVTQAVVVGGFALPGLVVALAVSSLVLDVPGLGALHQTLPVLVFAYCVHFGAQSLRSATVSVAAVSRRYDEAARTLGAARWRRFVGIELPLMAPGLLAGGGIVLLSTMKELPITLLAAPLRLEPFGVRFQTLATVIWNDAEDGFLAHAGLASLVLVAVSGVLTWWLVIRRADRIEG